jgi:hypothetical protein
MMKNFKAILDGLIIKLRKKGLKDKDIAHLLFLDPLVLTIFLFGTILDIVVGVNLYWVTIIGTTLIGADMLSHYMGWWN